MASPGAIAATVIHGTKVVFWWLAYHHLPPTDCVAAAYVIFLRDGRDLYVSNVRHRIELLPRNL